jgi:hypothetical protein
MADLLTPTPVAGLELVRDLLVPVAVRAKTEDDEASDDLGIMEVRYSILNEWYRINSWWEGDFLERAASGAFKKTIDSHNRAKNVDAHNMKTLFNHGMDFHIGDKLLGNITRAAEEKDSPVNDVRLYDTSYNRDLLPGLRDGGYGSSFMFRVVVDEWNNEPGVSDHNPEGLPERTLKEVRVFEAGPVTFPANPLATAGMRCMGATDRYYDDLAKRGGSSRVETLRDKVRALRPTTAGNPTVIDLAAAAVTPDEPVTDHSARDKRTGTIARLAREARIAALTR